MSEDDNTRNTGVEVHKKESLIKLSIAELEKKSRKKYFSKSQEIKHYLALYLTKPLVKTKITPNQITFLWIIIQIMSSFLMLGDYYYRLMGVLIFNFFVSILDSVDGNLARIREQKTSRGAYLEVVGLFLGTPLIFSMLSIGFFLKSDNHFLLILSFFGILGTVYSKLFVLNPKWFPEDKREKFNEIDLCSPIRKKGKLLTIIGSLFRRGQPFNILLLGMIFNLPELTITIYSIVFILQFLQSLISNYIKAGKIY